MTIQSETIVEARKDKSSLIEMITKIGAVVSLIGGVIGLAVWLLGGLHPRVAGQWIVEDQTAATSYAPFKGVTATYDIFLTQTGTTLTGSGNKMREGGKSLPTRERTPIKISGDIGFTSIDATFTERGTLRQSTGAFHWRRKWDGSWVGTFESDVANSSGPSSIKRKGTAPER